MKIVEIEGFTHTLGEKQGYRGLPVKASLVHCSVNGEKTPCLQSEWSLSQEEIENLKHGGSIILTLVGEMHPPVQMEVKPITFKISEKRGVKNV